MFGFGCIQFQLGVNEGASASFSFEPGPGRWAEAADENALE